MKSLVINTTLGLHRTLFNYRMVIPVAIILTLIIVSLLLPGTVLAGPGTSSSRCGANC